MKVFISWSGERSRQLGEAIRDWLPLVLQSVEPYFTPADIDKGARWHGEIVQALEKSDIGLIILTQQNLASQWIMFEAGAIARSVERARVCPLLFDIKKTDLQGPLSFFQAADFTQEDFRSVVITINKAQQRPLPEATLTKVFDQWWPDLQRSVKSIMEATQSAEAVPQKRSEKELLEESLLLIRTLVMQQHENTQALTQLLLSITGPTGQFPWSRPPSPDLTGTLGPPPGTLPWLSFKPPEAPPQTRPLTAESDSKKKD
jgi:TIR domain